MSLSKSGNKVFFLNPPSENFNIQKISENLKVVNYKKRISGLRFLPVKTAALLIKYEITYLENKLDLSFDVIWNFDSSRFFSLSLLKNKLRISHIVDWSENINRDLLCRTSDICFCSNQFLYHELLKHNQNTFNIGHGYHPSDYTLSMNERQSLDSKYKIKAGYLGNLSLKYIDWETIYSLIKENQDIGFYFIGPEGKSNLSGKDNSTKEFVKVKNLPNAIFLGAKSSEKIPALLNCFDILFLVYKNSGFHEQLANPHKILEYLGSGNPIISSWISEYQNENDLLYMVKENSNYIKKFEEFLDNLDSHNKENYRMKRKDYALKNSYQEKIKQIEDLITNNVND